MNLVNEKIVLACAVGIGIIMLVLSEWFFKFHKKKATAGLIISVIFLGVLGYYAYLIFYVKSGFICAPGKASPEPAPAVPAAPSVSEPAVPVSVVLEISGQQITAEPDDEIEIRKTALFKIVAVKTPPGPEKIKANLVGFVGNPQYNDGQDVGYVINYGKMEKTKALDSAGRKYKIEIKSGQDIIGNLYIKFVD